MNKKPASQFANKKLNFGGVLASEFLKFRTLTTNWVMTAVITVFMLSLSVLGGFLVNQIHERSLSAVTEAQTMQAEASTGQATGGMESASSLFDLGDRVHTMGSMGVDLGNILIASVAVVFIAAEYATRSINTTMTAVPKRSMIYLAKLLVVSIYSLVMGFVLSTVGFFIGYMMIDSAVKDQFPIESGIFLNCLAVGIYFMMLSWMGLGFGALMRNNAGGIVLVVVCLFILTLVVGLFTLGFSWAADFMEYLPNVLGREMLAYTVDGDAKFNNVEAAGWLSLWCIIPALLGYLRIRFTDPK